MHIYGFCAIFALAGASCTCISHAEAFCGPAYDVCRTMGHGSAGHVGCRTFKETTLVVCSSGGDPSNGDNDAYAKLQEENSKLRDEIIQLKVKAFVTEQAKETGKDLKKEMEPIKKTMESINGKVQNLEKEMQPIKKTVQNLEKAMQPIKKTVQNLENEIRGPNGLASINGKVQKLENDVNGPNGLASINGKVQKLENDVNGPNGLASINEKVKKLEDEVNGQNGLASIM